MQSVPATDRWTRHNMALRGRDKAIFIALRCEKLLFTWNKLLLD